jgi:hypothetical protein
MAAACPGGTCSTGQGICELPCYCPGGGGARPSGPLSTPIFPR